MIDLALESFLHAAHQGMLVWVQCCDGESIVMGGDHPGPDARTDVGALFAAALREHFGMAASHVAEREFGLSERRQRTMPSRTLLRAAACADAALSLLMAQATTLRFEFSAEYQGHRFLLLCRELSIPPMALSTERRRAIDQALMAGVSPTEPPSAEALRRRLTQLLTEGLH